MESFPGKVAELWRQNIPRLGPSASMITSAGIIAAGEGSRLRVQGIEVSKPLVPIAGIP